MISFSDLPSIVSGELRSFKENNPVQSIFTDSRKAVISSDAVFFAIRGAHHNGHDYLKNLFDSGVRQFVVEEFTDKIPQHQCNVIKVRSSIDALQKLAAFHRSHFKMPIIGITGSNGKTIVKEWLYQLMSEDYKIAKNPGSYNSQLGVPLSVWQLQDFHQLGLFEAGISKPGEMQNLAGIIRPTLGIFTNIGSAHDEGFESREQKLAEKLALFKETELLIYCKDHSDVDAAVRKLKLPSLSWGFTPGSDFVVTRESSKILIKGKEKSFNLLLPFVDQASIENLLHCITVMIHFGYDEKTINKRIGSLASVPMRLELKEGINQSQIIDDTYNNDLAGLQISIDFLSNQQQKKTKRLILSEILESGIEPDLLAEKIALMIQNRVDAFVGIGKLFLERRKLFPPQSQLFETTDDFLSRFDFNQINQEIVLVKGARSFQFEKIVNKLQRRFHGTIMEIDLGAVVENLNYFKSRIKTSTKIMAMVKAFAYGSGSTEIANLLQYHKVDYLGVAYADEGVDLRKNNISLPIMVMNPSEESFPLLLEYNIEPEVYSFKILESLLTFLAGRKARIHIKLDTGMHRLGFSEDDIVVLTKSLQENSNVIVASIFSHLAGADESQHDDFSKSQAEKFITLADKVANAIGYRPLYHVLNSAGIMRLPEFQFDMVRLGIGLYGVDPTEFHNAPLKPVATLKTVVSQIKNIKKGETVGYGRKGVALNDMTLATIAIGYADGFSRAFSRGVGVVLINGKPAKVVGNVCMDMTMVDVTGIGAVEGDEVIVFGKNHSLHKLAQSINTIPYEILTSTSERVKRVFVAESI
jgi:Alr-MurF fusion protein